MIIALIVLFFIGWIVFMSLEMSLEAKFPGNVLIFLGAPFALGGFIGVGVPLILGVLVVILSPLAGGSLPFSHEMINSLLAFMGYCLISTVGGGVLVGLGLACGKDN